MTEFTIFRISCVVGAVYLLANGIDKGWGWLIFTAAICGVSTDTKDSGRD